MENYSLWLQFQCQSWLVSEKRSLHVATCYCAVSRVPLPAQQSLFFPIPEQGFGEVQEVIIDTSETLAWPTKTKYLATYPIPKTPRFRLGLSYEAFVCRVFLISRTPYCAGHSTSVSASSGPLKGFVMPVSLRAQWSSERSSEKSSSPSLPFFRDVAFCWKKHHMNFCHSAWFLWPALHSARFFADVEMLNVLTHEFRPVSLPFYRIVKLIRVSAANWIAKYRQFPHFTSCLNLFISWFLLSLSFTLQPVPNVRLLLSFFFGWMGTASPVNNHGRITSGGFYRSGVENNLLFESPFVFGVLVSHRTLQRHRRNTGSVSVQICAETSWSGDEGRNASQCKQLNTTIWKLFAQFL